MKKILLTIIYIFVHTLLFGQDFQLSQFYSAPSLLNPGLAGASGGTRVGLNARNQWSLIGHPIKVNALSLDHYFSDFNSGIGIVAITEKAGSGALKNQKLGLIYSYNLSISDKWKLRTGLQFAFASRSLNSADLLFGDQIHQDAITGTQETISGRMVKNYFDFSGGTVLSRENFWIGLSAFHLNNPNVSFTERTSELPLLLSLQGGYKFIIESGSVKNSYDQSNEKSLTPTFLYKAQGAFRQLDLGVYMDFEPVVLGVWYRGVPGNEMLSSKGREAVVLLAGATYKEFRFGYSYDITVSKLSVTNSGGAHEISCSYVFKEKQSRKPKVKYRRLPCPVF
ncbi:MAG: type IX secretion system membrane protein PorP/SprF [Cytophagaceae bacterium]